MIIGLIPARGGSKGIPGKNLIDFGGKPLLARTIETALDSKLDRVFVTSDDDDILAAAEKYGAIPLKRPTQYADDKSPAADVINHAIRSIRTDHTIGHICYLQPTSPLRRTQHIDDAIEIITTTGADTVVSVVEVPHNCIPGSIMLQTADGRLQAYDSTNKITLLRQSKPTFYARNGPAILVLRTSFFTDTGSFYSGDTRPYIMDRESSVDIDDAFDLKLARLLWAAR